ncbi:branched-chain amino acid ABC transporter substrate-binding protein [Desulfolithobacter sp.]
MAFGLCLASEDFRLRQRRWLSLLFVLLVLTSATGCSGPEHKLTCEDPLGCVEIPSGAPVRIGVLQALSGKIAPLGRDQVRGLELALADSGREIAGHPVVLQIEDTGCTPEGGANAALKVIADPQTAALFGTTCSAAAATASQVMSDAGMTMISGNNSAPYLTSIGGKAAPGHYPGYFRTAYNEEVSGKAAAWFAYHRLGIRRAATINDGDIYTIGLTDGFEAEFVRLGGIITLAASINKGDTDMEPVLTAVHDSKASLLFFPLFQPEGIFVLHQARKMTGLGGIVLMSDGALIENFFIQSVGDLGRGMYFVGPAIPDTPNGRELHKRYVDRYGEEPSSRYYLSAYDAARLLFDAIEQVAVQGPGGELLVGRQALRDALGSMDREDGVSGGLHCDEFGDCGTPVFNILRLDDPGLGVEGLRSNILFTYPTSS